MTWAFNTVKRILEWIPNWLRRFVGYGVSLSMVLFLWLIWGTGYIQEKLNIPTRADVERVKEKTDTNNALEQQRAIAITASQVVSMAMDSARIAQDSLFNALVKDVIEPGIERQNRLFEQVRELNRRMGINNEKLDAQASTSERASTTMEELRVLMNSTMTVAERNELMALMKKIDADQERIKAKLKIKTQEF